MAGVVVAVAVAVAVGGCGSAVSLRAPCKPAAVTAFADAAGIPSARVGARRSVGNNAEPQCTLSAPGARGRAGTRTQVVVNVDSAPQAYFRFERTLVEFQQMFALARSAPAPQFLTGLGLGAAWLPAADQVMATDARRLITVTVTWPGAPAARKIRLGEAEARRYLGPNDLAAAKMSP